MNKQSKQDDFSDIKELFQEIAQQFKELAEQTKETDARFIETDARFKDTDEQLRRLEGLFGIQWGRMIEALVAPAALQLFRDRGIDVHSSYQRQKSRINGRTMELDIVLENDQDSVVIEVKSLVRVEDVLDFLQDLAEIPAYFKRFDNRRIYGAIAGLEFAADADRYAYRRGLFVLGLTGEGLVKVRNDGQFQPVDFGEMQRQ